MIFNVVDAVALVLTRSLRRWQMGPQTDEGRRFLREIDLRRSTISQIEDEISQLETDHFVSRQRARRERDTWLNRNRQALVVNVVAGAIVGLPIFGLGVAVAVLFDL